MGAIRSHQKFAATVFLFIIILEFSDLISGLRSQANVSLKRDHWRSLDMLSNGIKLLFLSEGKNFNPLNESLV